VSEGRTFANLRQAVVVATASGAAECAIAFCWLVSGLPAWAALSAHAAVIAGLAVWSCCSAEARADIRLPLLLAVSTAALGPFGAAGTLLTAILARRHMRRALPFEQWYQSIFPDTEDAANTKLLAEIEDEEPAETEPVTSFSDVLAFGSLRQKQDLIAFISRNFRPEFGPILKQALSDRESVIRVQAATAMSKLESSIMERTLDLRQRARQNPRQPEALRALARHYDTWLFSGVLDPKREEDILAAAIEVYRKCLTAEPGNPETLLAAGRLLLRKRRYGEASECFGKILDVPSTASRAALWQMESLFHLRKFEEVRRLAQAWSSGREPAAGYPLEAAEAIRLWVARAPVSGALE
jgi:polysaccharide biosynthesis protein PelE